VELLLSLRWLKKQKNFQGFSALSNENRFCLSAILLPYVCAQNAEKKVI
jgi:hypothetical protein